MFRGRRVIAIVAARGGSKGLPGKNVASCAGRPLIEWTIEAARGAPSLDRLVVTTDDETIAAAARAVGAEVPFVRPAALASDTTPMSEVVQHALGEMGDGWDVGVLLQVTSPLRTGPDIEGTLAALDEAGTTTAVSVTRAAKSPWWMYTRDDRGTLVPVLAHDNATRRQDLPAVYSLNGAVYAFEIETFRRTGRFVDEATASYVMPEERSVDVDTAIDLAFAELLLTRRSP